MTDVRAVTDAAKAALYAAEDTFISVGTQTFTPEQFGTPTGTDPSVDMPLVNSALLAARAAGGGRVLFQNRYAHKRSGQINVGRYPMQYSWTTQQSNLTLEALPGADFLLTEAPASKPNYAVFVIGKGLYDIGVQNYPIDPNSPYHAPTPSFMDVQGEWYRNLTLKNLKFNNSVLTDADRTAMSVNQLASGVITVAGVHTADIGGIDIDKSWGADGGIHTTARTDHVHLHDCHIAHAYQHGFFVDGATNFLLENLSVDDCLVYGGIQLGQNGDYQRVSTANVVQNCNVPQIAVNGSNNLIQDCTLVMPSWATNNHFALFVRSYNTENGSADAVENTFQRCMVSRAAGGPAHNGIGICVLGVVYNGRITKASHNHFLNNRFDSSLQTKVSFSGYSEYNNVDSSIDLAPQPKATLPPTALYNTINGVVQ